MMRAVDFILFMLTIIVLISIVATFGGFFFGIGLNLANLLFFIFTSCTAKKNKPSYELAS